MISISKITRMMKNKGKRSNNKHSAKLHHSQKQMKALSSSMEKNLSFISEMLSADTDMVIGRIGNDNKLGIVYIRGLTDKDALNKYILEPLVNALGKFKNLNKTPSINRLEFSRGLLKTVDVKEIKEIEQAITAVLYGNVCLFVDGTDSALVIGNIKFDKRSIEVPETDTVVRGSREGFIEDISTNVSMVRRRLCSPDLRFETYFLGRISSTEIRLSWIEGLANPKIIEEARTRIQRVDIDYIHGSGLIAELIEDKPSSLWPQVHMSERPDVVASNLVEGRFAIFCNGFPYVIIAPSLFWQNLQTPDDYSEKPLVGSFFRLLRHMAFYLALMMSPLFVAIVSFHPSIIPQLLALKIAAGREGVPLPSIFEALLLTVMIDLLREAGARLPKPIGVAVAVLGAVIIGQAAVAAGFVSPTVIIVISVAAIANFSIPSLELANAVRIANYFLIILGGTLGLLGVTVGMAWLLWTVISLRSFGIPLFYPVAPGENYGLKDIFFRAPVWQLRKRPSLLAQDNKKRMGGSTVKPKPKDRG